MSTFNAQRSTLNIQPAASLDVERWTLNACSRFIGVGRLSKRLASVGIASSIAISSLAQDTPTPAEPPRDLTVLILGDSLGLCGFSKRLDQKFRADPRVKSVFTYCTCGMNPMSWVKKKPFALTLTDAVYCRIDSGPAAQICKELRDT